MGAVAGLARDDPPVRSEAGGVGDPSRAVVDGRAGGGVAGARAGGLVAEGGVDAVGGRRGSVGDAGGRGVHVGVLLGRCGFPWCCAAPVRRPVPKCPERCSRQEAQKVLIKNRLSLLSRLLVQFVKVIDEQDLE